MIDRLTYIELLEKYLDGHISAAEKNEFFKMSTDNGIRQFLEEMIDEDWKSNQLTGSDIPPHVSEKMLLTILNSEKNTDSLFSYSPKKNFVHIFSMAAIFLLIVLGGAFYYYSIRQKDFASQLEASIPPTNIKKVNTNSLPLEVVLEDGSSVKLTRNSTLSYPKRFASDKREVYLTGEALFVVAKNPEKPFLVYYNNIVTRVLGTSFIIKTNSNTKDLEVSVITGKVHVFENKLLASNTSSREELKSVILVPNQKAMYNIKRHDFETTLADSIRSLVGSKDIPKVNTSEAFPKSFIYEKSTSLKEIFHQLETVYGIEIVVDNDNIYNCVFIGDVSKLEVLKKLNTICLTVGATYEVKGTKILISGKGCNKPDSK
ncbi:MAG: FecR family protein [Chitinophagaceae bacterium]|nr:FecR family protein [Chitinophagaceae bacterium]